MKILFIGDIMGKPGRRAVRKFMDRKGGEYDLVIANGENVASGKGLTAETARELFDVGVHVLTGGNHIFRNRDVFRIIQDERIVRPANYPPGAETPGHGMTIIDTQAGCPVAVINLMGRVYMNHFEDPYACAERLIDQLEGQVALRIVDFHAEATSEKLAMFRILDGRVTAVIGTHTHVQTADAQVSSLGTAYITDAGMTGPHDSILGIASEIAIRQLRTGLPVRHEVATGDVNLCGVEIEADMSSGQALSIRRIYQPMEG